MQGLRPREGQDKLSDDADRLPVLQPLQRFDPLNPAAPLHAMEPLDTRDLHSCEVPPSFSQWMN